MEVCDVLAVLAMMGLAVFGVIGVFGSDYPLFHLWTGRPGRIASWFLILPAVVSILVTAVGLLGRNRSASAYSVANIVILVGGVGLSLVAGWLADRAPEPRGAPDQGVGRCARCADSLLSREQVMTEQGYLVQLGKSDAARVLEQRSGYRCQSCGRTYCRGCLERAGVPHPEGGVACPACGGRFGYL